VKIVQVRCEPKPLNGTLNVLLDVGGGVRDIVGGVWGGSAVLIIKALESTLGGD
jgi:hypothetical protein